MIRLFWICVVLFVLALVKSASMMVGEGRQTLAAPRLAEFFSIHRIPSVEFGALEKRFR